MSAEELLTQFETAIDESIKEYEELKAKTNSRRERPYYIGRINDLERLRGCLKKYNKRVEW